MEVGWGRHLGMRQKEATWEEGRRKPRWKKAMGSHLGRRQVEPPGEKAVGSHLGRRQGETT